jgi:hypothetical protein
MPQAYDMARRFTLAGPQPATYSPSSWALWYDLACVQGGTMPIYRLLQNMPMGPEEIGRLTTAYEQALRTIGLVDRNDPIAEMVAKKIIEIGQTGVRDPAEISALAIKELGVQ